MRLQMTTSWEPDNSARPSAFLLLSKRFKDEHDRLKENVDSLCDLNRRFVTATGVRRVLRALTYLRARAADLLTELERHAEWEEETLFPVLTTYYRHKIRPEMMPSLEVLKQGHALALPFFDAFLSVSNDLLDQMARGSGRCDYETIGRLKRASDHLMQGCLVLREHFQMEKELLFPLTEDILTDIDYLFS